MKLLRGLALPFILPNNIKYIIHHGKNDNVKPNKVLGYFSFCEVTHYLVQKLTYHASFHQTK